MNITNDEYEKLKEEARLGRLELNTKIKEIKKAKGKIYHVICGNTREKPKPKDLEGVRDCLIEAYPDINWLVTSYIIKIEEK